MKDIEESTPEAHLAGLENRLKSEDRCKEKLAYEFRAKPDRDISEISEAADRMHDILRYTYLVSAASYTDGYNQLRGKLEGAGNELLAVRNFWSDSEYKGVNTRWHTNEGQPFEVQFHTRESFTGKQLTHEAYERLRTDPVSKIERYELEEFQRIVTSKIEIPVGVESIEDYRREDQ
jgi:hypothetical protein